MGQTLPHGVYLPDNGERNCYTGLSQNWQKLDNLIGSHGDTVSFSQTLTEGVEIGKITINGVDVSLYHTDYSDKADADNVYTKAEVDTLLSTKAKASDLTAHTSDTDIHVTTSDKSKWNGKQDALSAQQLSNIADVTNKANDSDVVHKSGDETIDGFKTFTQGINIQSSNIDLLTTPTSNKYSSCILKDKNNKDLCIIQYAQRSNGVNDLDLYVYDKNSVARGIQITTNHEVSPIGNDYSLGSARNGLFKWKAMYATSIFGGANNIDCSVDSQGDGWIRYSNGLQICWGAVLRSDSKWEMNFPKPFNSVPSCIGNNDSNYANFVIAVQTYSTSTQAVFVATAYNGSTLGYSGQKVRYIAIGTWK